MKKNRRQHYDILVVPSDPNFHGKTYKITQFHLNIFKFSCSLITICLILCCLFIWFSMSLFTKHHNLSQYTTSLETQLTNVNHRIAVIEDDYLRITTAANEIISNDHISIAINDTFVDALANIEKIIPKSRHYMANNFGFFDRNPLIAFNETTTNAELATDALLDLHDYIEDTRMIQTIPLSLPTNGFLSSHFGLRISPITQNIQFHRGIDISTYRGQPIVAVSDGIVKREGFDPTCGNMITIDHGYGIKTRYCHASKTFVNDGDPIQRGDVIALVGSTGRSTGPHVHYELLVDGKHVNPLRYVNIN